MVVFLLSPEDSFDQLRYLELCAAEGPRPVARLDGRDIQMIARALFQNGGWMDRSRPHRTISA